MCVCARVFCLRQKRTSFVMIESSRCGAILGHCMPFSCYRTLRTVCCFERFTIEVGKGNAQVIATLRSCLSHADGWVRKSAPRALLNAESWLKACKLA